MSKTKVLTVKFDVTNLDKIAVNWLLCAVVAQGEKIAVYDANAEFCNRTEAAEVLSASVCEIEVEGT